MRFTSPWCSRRVRLSEEIVRIIEEGLYHDNLLRLIPLCDALFDENPPLYGTLKFIFASLANEYDNQGIPVDRYRLILETIQEPIVMLLKADKDSPTVFLDRLSVVFRSFASLKT